MLGIRRIAGLLTASAALIAALMLQEDFDPVASRPVPHDPPTYGYGATVRADGKPVRVGDTITREAAASLLGRQVEDNYSRNVRRCLGDAVVYQHEFDAAVDLAYSVGWPKVCSSTMLREFHAGNYVAGCEAIKLFDRLHGRKCSLPENRNRRDGCRGILARRQKQFLMCSEAVYSREVANDSQHR